MKTSLFICSLFCSYIAVAQNVGIGVPTPTEKLEVNGNVKATNVIATNSFQLTTGAAAGKVLTSNASGVGSWVTPGTSSGGSISSTGTLGAFAGVSLPTTLGTFSFFGPTTTVTLNGNQRVVMNMVAGLGRASAGTDFFTLDIGYQLQPAGPIVAISGLFNIEYKPVFPAAGGTNPYTITGSFKPAAGTYKIGCLIGGNTIGFLDLNNNVNGYYMIINE
jgi:hypothetical protein